MKENVTQATLEGSLEFADRVNRRCFGVIITLIICWAFSIAVFVIYLSLPVEETSISQSTDNITESEVTQTIGDNYGESDTK